MPPDKAHRAVQGVRKKSGQSVIAEIRPCRWCVETSYAPTNPWFPEAIAETKAQLQRRIADSNATVDRAVAAAKIEANGTTIEIKAATERNFGVANRQAEVTQSRLDSRRWMLGVAYELPVALLAMTSISAMTPLSRPPRSTPIPAAPGQSAAPPASSQPATRPPVPQISENK